MIILIALATFGATLLGGLLAIRFRDKLHLILGFSAGAVVGVAFFDLLPEAVSLGSGFFNVSTITGVVALGFLAYLCIDRAVVFFSPHGPEDIAVHVHDSHSRGTLGAGSLSTHSFLDGLAIGLAFQVSPAIGWVVAFAVLAHDFSDGINTVNLVLKNNGDRRHAFWWLLADAAAPVLGVTATLFFTLPEKYLSLILALFCGFFLYIGASDLIPESHHNHPRILTTIMTLCGAAALFIIVTFAGI